MFVRYEKTYTFAPTKKEDNGMIQSTLINLAVLHIIRVVVICSKA